MLSAKYFNAHFPSSQPLGLRLENHTLAYTVGGKTRRVSCCVVAGSSWSRDILPGDILVAVNDLPLININVTLGKDHVTTVNDKLAEHANFSRTVRLLRSSGLYDPSYKTTILSMTAEEAVFVFDDEVMKKVHEDERRYFETNPASGSTFSVNVPVEQTSLGLKIIVQQLNYVTDSGLKNKIDCCVVTESAFLPEIQPGDIVVKINFQSVISNKDSPSTSSFQSKAFLDRFLRVVADAEKPLKVTLLRPKEGVGLSGLSPRLIMRLSRDVEQTMFSTGPMTEEEEIARRVEEQLYRMQREKEQKRKIEEEARRREAEARRATEEEEARRLEYEVMRRVEDEKRRIAEELERAEAEAKALEEEAERIALELKKAEDEERAKRVQEEVKKRLDLQAKKEADEAEAKRIDEEVKKRALEQAKILASSWGVKDPVLPSSLSSASSASRATEDIVQMRAQEEARRLAEEMKRAHDEQESRRMEEEVKRRAAEEARKLLLEADPATRAKKMEEEVQRRAEAEAMRMVEEIRRKDESERLRREAEEARLMARRMEEERQRAEAEARARRVEEAVQRRVEEEARRIREQLQLKSDYDARSVSRADEESKARKLAEEAKEKAASLEEEIKQRIAAELAAKLGAASAAALLQGLGEAPKAAAPEMPSVPSTPGPSAASVKVSPLSTAVGASAGAGTPAADTTEPIALPPGARATTYTDDDDVVVNSINFPPLRPGYISKIIELSNLPTDSLGLTLIPYNVELEITPYTKQNIVCAVVRDSAVLDQVKAGDVLISVSGKNLMIDEHRFPGYENFIRGIGEVMSAQNPRILRFFRTSAINLDKNKVTIEQDEAERVAPVIFKQGDGSHMLIDVLNKRAAMDVKRQNIDQKMKNLEKDMDKVANDYKFKELAKTFAYQQLRDKPPEIIEYIVRGDGGLVVDLTPVTLYGMNPAGAPQTFKAVMIVGVYSNCPLMPGDVLMFVNTNLLLTDEQLTPGGRRHLNGVLYLVGEAKYPKPLRFIRFASLDPANESYRMSEIEAKKFAEAIYRTGDLGETINYVVEKRKAPAPKKKLENGNPVYENGVAVLEEVPDDDAPCPVYMGPPLGARILSRDEWTRIEVEAVRMAERYRAEVLSMAAAEEGGKAGETEVFYVPQQRKTVPTNAGAGLAPTATPSNPVVMSASGTAPVPLKSNLPADVYMQSSMQSQSSNNWAGASAGAGAGSSSSASGFMQNQPQGQSYFPSQPSNNVDYGYPSAQNQNMNMNMGMNTGMNMGMNQGYNSSNYGQQNMPQQQMFQPPVPMSMPQQPMQQMQMPQQMNPYGGNQYNDPSAQQMPLAGNYGGYQGDFNPMANQMGNQMGAGPNGYMNDMSGLQGMAGMQNFNDPSQMANPYNQMGGPGGFMPPQQDDSGAMMPMQPPMPMPVPLQQQMAPEFLAVVYEIAYQLPGSLGMEIAPHTIAYQSVQGQQIVHCCVVSETKGPIKRGDVFMSVNGNPLVADPSQSPGGPEHMVMVGKILEAAEPPRRFRFFRSKSINLSNPVSVIDPADVEVFLEG